MILLNEQHFLYFMQIFPADFCRFVPQIFADFYKGVCLLSAFICGVFHQRRSAGRVLFSAKSILTSIYPVVYQISQSSKISTRLVGFCLPPVRNTTLLNTAFFNSFTDIFLLPFSSVVGSFKAFKRLYVNTPFFH